jgi:hypothetical protein
MMDLPYINDFQWIFHIKSIYIDDFHMTFPVVFPCSHLPVSSMVDFPSAMMVFEKLVPVKKNKNRAEL